MSRYSNRIKPFKFLIGQVILVVGLLFFILVPYTHYWLPVIASVIYSILSPPIFNTERFFLKIGYANVVSEFQWHRKLLLFIFPLLLIVDIVVGMIIYGDTSATEETIALHVIVDYFVSYVAIGVMIRFITMIVRKDFRIYFAKGCCKIISEKGDDLEKVKYLRLLLESYDKYLKRRIKVGIDENKIYSTILYKTDEERSQIMNQICKSLEGRRLDLANYLSSIHKTPDSEFYIVETLLQKLKAIGVILATAIPIIISILGFIVRI